MTNENAEWLSKAQAIIDGIAPNYIFGHYTLDDVRQEAWAYTISASNNNVGIEDLQVHLKNRLCSWKRQHYSRDKNGNLVYTKL